MLADVSQKHEPIVLFADFQHESVWTEETIDAVSGVEGALPVNWTGLTVDAEIALDGNAIISLSSASSEIILLSQGVLTFRIPKERLGNLCEGADYKLNFYVTNAGGDREFAKQFSIAVRNPRQ